MTRYDGCEETRITGDLLVQSKTVLVLEVGASELSCNGITANYY
jgi:hypothetical protein